MRSKNFKKKLFLNKKTISNLNGSQMMRVQGGVVTVRPCYISQEMSACPECISDSSCDTCYTCECPPQETVWTECLSGCVC